MPIIVATANVQDLPDLTRKQVRRCGATLARMGVSVAGLQETAELQDLADLRTSMPGYEVLEFPGTAREDAIVYDPAVLHLEWTDHYQAHKGLPEVSPNRHTTVAAFTRVGRPNVPPFVVRNRHMVSKSTDPHATELAWRVEHWRVHFDADRRHARGVHADGYAIFDVGDFNRRHVGRYLLGTRWLLNAGIDKVAFTPAAGGPEFDMLEQLNEPTPSDHNARAVVGRLVRV